MAYGYEFQNRENDTLYRGKDLEFVIDDEKDIGEVYLDGNLIFQQTEVYSDSDLQRSFKQAFETVQSEDGPLDQDTDDIGYQEMDSGPVFVPEDDIDIDQELEDIEKFQVIKQLKKELIVLFDAGFWFKGLDEYNLNIEEGRLKVMGWDSIQRIRVNQTFKELYPWLWVI